MVSSTLLFSHTDEYDLESITVNILVVRKFPEAERGRKKFKFSFIKLEWPVVKLSLSELPVLSKIYFISRKSSFLHSLPAFGLFQRSFKSYTWKWNRGRDSTHCQWLRLRACPNHLWKFWNDGCSCFFFSFLSDQIRTFKGTARGRAVTRL